VRLDMSEFMERHTVSKLIGSPRGHVGYSEGGQLTRGRAAAPLHRGALRRDREAHPDVFNMMLQVRQGIQVQGLGAGTRARVGQTRVQKRGAGDLGAGTLHRDNVSTLVSLMLLSAPLSPPSPLPQE